MLAGSFAASPVDVRVAAGANGGVFTLHRTTGGSARLARLAGGVLAEVPSDGSGGPADIYPPEVTVTSIDLTLQFFEDNNQFQVNPNPIPIMALAARNASVADFTIVQWLNSFGGFLVQGFDQPLIGPYSGSAPYPYADFSTSVASDTRVRIPDTFSLLTAYSDGGAGNGSTAAMYRVVLGSGPENPGSAAWTLLGQRDFSDGEVRYLQLELTAAGVPIVAFSKVRPAAFHTPVCAPSSSGLPMLALHCARVRCSSLPPAPLTHFPPVQVADGGKASVLRYGSAANSWTMLGGGPASAGEARDVQLALAQDGSPYLAYADMTLGGEGEGGGVRARGGGGGKVLLSMLLSPLCLGVAANQPPTLIILCRCRPRHRAACRLRRQPGLAGSGPCRPHPRVCGGGPGAGG